MFENLLTKFLDKVIKTKQSAFMWAGFLIGFLIFKCLDWGSSFFELNSYGNHIILQIFKIVFTLILLFLVPILIIRGQNLKK